MTKLDRLKFIKCCNEISGLLITNLPDKNNEYQMLVRNFHNFIHERIDSFQILIKHNCLWDAEIILRAITEATIKIVFISGFTGDRQLDKINEFWNEFSEVHSLKDSHQSKMILEYLKDSKIDSKTIMQLILNEIDEKNLSNKWTKQKRQQLNQSWSFSEMLKILSKESNNEAILCLSRNYTQSSHLIHADETALGVIRDRKQRSDCGVIEEAHRSRLFNDCICLYLWVLSSVLKSLGNSEEGMIKKIMSKYIHV